MSAIDERALAVIASTPLVLTAMLQGQRDELAPEGGVWGAREIVAHLVDADGIAFVERITRIVSEERPYIRSIDPGARLVAGGYLELSAVALVEELAQLRSERVAWLRTLDPAALDRCGEHDHAGDITARNIIHQWAYHDLQHLGQLSEALQTPLIPQMGNTRRFYDV